MPATAIIQFIGIIVFTRQLSSNGSLQAIMPRIPIIPYATSSSSADHTSAMKESHPQIEPHIALIAFPTAAYDDAQSTWKATTLRSDKRLSFVLLNGDNVTFTSPGIATAQSADMALVKKATSAIDSEAVPELPRLTRCCATIGALNPHNPDAIINLPAVAARACAPRDSEGGYARIDTHLRIPVVGNLVISATRLSDRSRRPAIKTLVLRGDAHVIIAHVPTWYLQGDRPFGVDVLHPMAAHYLAYFAMTDGGNGCNSFDCAKAPVTDVCEWMDVRDIVNPPHPAPPPPSPVPNSELVDFQCSNSQYP